MGCAAGIAKYVLFGFNLVFALAGLALLIIGVLYKLNVTEFTEAIPEEYSALEFIPILLIVVGCIVFVIAFFGCCGAIKESSCMLTTYAVILLILLILQVALGVVAFLQVKDGTDLQTQFAKSIRELFQRYQESTGGSREAVNGIQQEFQCCGLDGPGDWGTNLPGAIPNSCCEGNPASCSMTSAFKQGCTSRLTDFVQSLGKTIGIVVICIAAVELVGAIFALCLSSSIKNQHRRGAYA